MKLVLMVLSVLVSGVAWAGPQAKPDDAEAHVKLGNALEKKGDHDGAIAEYRTAIRLKPDDEVAHYNLGITLEEKGDLNGASAEYRTAIRLKPDDADAHYSLGMTLKKKGDLDGAIAVYREAVRLDQKSDTAHQYLGEALGAKGDFNGEYDEEREALRLSPENERARSDLNEAHRSRGNAKKYRNDNQESNAGFVVVIGFITLLGFGGGLFSFVKGFLVYREFRVFEDTPEIPIRSIAMGLSHFHGKAVGEQTVPGPVSKGPCYFYEVNIQRWATDSHGRNGQFQDYATFADGVKFYLKDATGRVLVDAHGAEYQLLKSGEHETSTRSRTSWRDTDKEWGAFIERAKPGSWPGLYRLIERTILPNGSYDVIGTCVENPQPKDQHDRKLIMKGQNETTFLISCWREESVKEELRKRATRYVFGGAGLAIACLAVFLVMIHWI